MLITSKDGFVNDKGEFMGKRSLSIVKKYYPQVRYVRDAKKSIVVHVSTSDCKKSTQKSPNSCAMAQAFRRKHDGAIISLSVAYIVDGNKAVKFRVPQAVSRELVSFDRHNDFAVGAYKLIKISRGNRMGERTKEDRHLNPKRSHRNKEVISHRTTGVRSL